MSITFYNHACFSIENEHNLLLCDPYLSGTAFNDGWDLIIEDIGFEFNFDKKNYIYYSHEHPDHFSIPFLTKIPEADRSKITVIYQQTNDQRVVTFLKKLGFAVEEVADEQRFELDPEFAITIGQVPFYDSWCCIHFGPKKIVNANDCILETPERVEDIKRLVGGCDILFTQFSYANWVEGGQQDAQQRQALAEEKLRRIDMQVKVLKPDFVVPFASMVRFCHQQNAYMNDSINTPKVAVDFIQQHTSAAPYLMVPYEQWDGEASKHNDAAIEFWEKAYQRALQRPLIEAKQPVELDQLHSDCEAMLARVKAKNNALLIRTMSRLGVLPTIRMYCQDIDQSVQFSWHQGLQELQAGHAPNVDLTLCSASLAFLFKFDFGIDTLNVNARFSGELRAKKALIRTFSVLALNNTGRYITLSSLLNMLFDVSFLKQGLRTVGLLRKPDAVS